MEPFIVKNFISNEDVIQLNKWTMSNYKNDFFKEANMRLRGTRLTTRYSDEYETTFSFPEIAYKVRQKIINYLGSKIEHFSYKQPIYKHGIVNGIGFNGDVVYSHKDPVWYPGTYTLHCNIISQKSLEGGVTWIEGVKYETEVNDLLVYKVSNLLHQVDEIKGNIPRILWVFGFSINERLIIK